MNKTQLERASNRIYSKVREAIAEFKKTHPSEYGTEEMTGIVKEALILNGYVVSDMFNLRYSLAGVVKAPTEEMLANKILAEQYSKKALALQEQAIDSLYFKDTDVAAALENLAKQLKDEK